MTKDKLTEYIKNVYKYQGLLTVGQKVYINPNSIFEHQGIRQDGSLMMGTVIENQGHPDYWVEVRWESGGCNNYPYNTDEFDIIPIVCANEWTA